MKKQINIFYSWQSDLDRETNQKAIRVQIKKSIGILEEQYDDYNLNLDEATERVAGSPEIPLTILNKINNSDIFVCDLTTVNGDTNDIRKMPNPNVIFELGYATSILGWERIIMLFNGNYGNFKEELPFDLEKRRVVSYNISDKDDNNGKGNLRDSIKNNLEMIILNNPGKVSEKNKSSDKIDPRKKDVQKLSEILSSIHIPTFDSFLHYLPNRILHKIFFFLYDFEAVFYSTSYHIYDQELNEKIEVFFTLWQKTLQHSNLFSPDESGNYILYIPFDIFKNKEDEEEFILLTKESILLREKFVDFLKYVRGTFLEIDVDELSEMAGDKYSKSIANKK